MYSIHSHILSSYYYAMPLPLTNNLKTVKLQEGMINIIDESKKIISY